MPSRTDRNIKFFMKPKNQAEDDKEDDRVINGEEVKNIFDVVDDFLEDDIQVLYCYFVVYKRGILLVLF